jgi:hypothetical protein
VTCATISSGAFVWILLGLGVGVWGTMWWELRQKKKGSESELGIAKDRSSPIAEDQRKEAAEERTITFRRCAVAYFVIILICFAVAVIAGGEGIAVLTALNVGHEVAEGWAQAGPARVEGLLWGAAKCIANYFFG